MLAFPNISFADNKSWERRGGAVVDRLWCTEPTGGFLRCAARS